MTENSSRERQSRQVDRLQTDIHKGIQTNRHASIQTDMQVDRHTDRQRYDSHAHTERQTDKQI